MVMAINESNPERNSQTPPFENALAQWLGVASSSLPRDAQLKAEPFETPLGSMVAVADRNQLWLLEFSDRRALPRELREIFKRTPSLGTGRWSVTDQIECEINEYFRGERIEFETPFRMEGSAFTRSVWEVLMSIPAGQLKSYAEIATELGRPQAARAVARANGANRLAIVIPCHRVIGSDGSLTGYGGGLWRKQKLIELERSLAAKM